MNVDLDIDIDETDEVSKLFKERVKKLKINGYVEKHTFKLVCEYLNGKFDDDINIVSEKFISKALKNSNNQDDVDMNYILIKNIEKKIKSKEKKISVNQSAALKHKLKDLKAYYFDLASLYRAKEDEKQEADKKGKREIDKKYQDMINEANQMVDYSIIELNGALGLSVECFNNSKIRNYCESILYDVNNDKYKRLSFKDHITSDGSINVYK